MTVAGLVLAAGRGERFGATKQLARVGGRPLVRIVCDTATTAGLAPVVVVVGHDGDEVAAAVPADVDVVVNPDHTQGQSTSLRVGLAALAPSPADAAVVLLADEPGTDPAVVVAVADRLAAGASLVRCRYRDRPGHPVGIARSRWRDAAAVTGDEGARGLLRSSETELVHVDGPAPTDVDTRADLAVVTAAVRRDRGDDRPPSR